MSSTSAAAPSSTRGRAAAVVIAVLALLAVLVLAVVGGGGEPGTAAAGTVAVEGGALPRLDDPLADPAVGQPAPVIAGAAYDGSPVVAPAADRPTVVLFLAHWCPACQQEVPRVQGWLGAGQEPDDIALVAVSTGIDPTRDNYPPEVWFEREGWTVPTMVDDEASQAAAAYGLPGYPYWVFVDGDGAVLGRHFGGLSTDALESLLQRMRELAADRPGEAMPLPEHARVAAAGDV